MLWTPERRHLPHIMVGCGAAVVIGGLLAFTLKPDDGAAVAAEGPGVRIAVVQPPEPPVIPGSRMDVGQLVDGYEHHPAPRMEPVMDAYPSDDALYAPETPPTVRRMSSRAPEVAPVQVAEARREPAPAWQGRPLSFGFDQPRPDYAAERRERDARREQEAAIRAQRREQVYADVAAFEAEQARNADPE